MSRSARRSAIVGVGLLCAGAGLLALFAAQPQPESSESLPPPFLVTRPAAWSSFPPSSTMPPDAATIRLAADPYRHPSGAFQVSYPEGWQVDEAEDSAQFTAPEAVGQFSLTFARLDSAPDPAYEQDLRQTWGDLPGFSLDAIESSGLPQRWTATFSFDQTLPPEQTQIRMMGFMLYLPQAGVRYTFTALMQSDLHETLMPVFQVIANSLQTDPNVIQANSE